MSYSPLPIPLKGRHPDRSVPTHAGVPWISLRCTNSPRGPSSNRLHQTQRFTPIAGPYAGLVRNGGMISGLDHVQIAAPPGCEEAARAFFCDLLGLIETPKPAALAKRGGVWFRLGRQELHIGVEQPFAPATKAHPALLARSVSDLETLADKLASAGHDVRWDMELPGVRRFYTSDPWGNRLELLAPGTHTS
jgi:catechol 2,3-dioxygenase-like lactoylglutathione lyase family enzyme